MHVEDQHSGSHLIGPSIIPWYPPVIVTRLTASLALLQEYSAAGRLQVHAIHCEEPLSFPLFSRTGYKMADLSSYRNYTSFNHSQVLVMAAGSYPVQITARTSGSIEGQICPFNCSEHLVDLKASCGTDGCHCGLQRGAPDKHLSSRLA
jgi:hypothetical protein